jgi:hypothetical protein
LRTQRYAPRISPDTGTPRHGSHGRSSWPARPFPCTSCCRWRQPLVRRDRRGSGAHCRTQPLLVESHHGRKPRGRWVAGALAHELRPVAGDSPLAEAVKVVARTHKTLIWERTRHTQRLRHALRDYFPAALVAFEDLDAADTLELLGRAPTPAQAAPADHRADQRRAQACPPSQRRREGRRGPGRAARRAPLSGGWGGPCRLGEGGADGQPGLGDCCCPAQGLIDADPDVAAAAGDAGGACSSTRMTRSGSCCDVNDLVIAQMNRVHERTTDRFTPLRTPCARVSTCLVWLRPGTDDRVDTGRARRRGITRRYAAVAALRTGTSTGSGTGTRRSTGSCT